MAVILAATRHHDISCAHRIYGHAGRCGSLHGHNYRISFTCSAGALDALGMVVDFGVIKSRLCGWLEDNWDHKTLLWREDILCAALGCIDGVTICPTEFNPTAENMAKFLVETVGPMQLDGSGVVLTSVDVEETRRCRASYSV